MRPITVKVEKTVASLILAKLQNALRPSRLALFFGACFALAYFRSVSAQTPLLPTFAVFAIGFAGFRVLAIGLSAAIQARSAYAATLTFTDEDVVIEDAQGKRNVGWPWVLSSAEDGKHLFLVHQKMPRRVVILSKKRLAPEDLRDLQTKLASLR